MIERLAAGGLVGLLLLATLGEGGAAPTSLLIWHGLLALLLALAWCRPAAAEREIAPAPAGAFLLFAALALLGALRAPYGFAAWLSVLELGCFAGVAWLAARSGPAWLSAASTPLLLAAAAESGLLLVERFALGEMRPAATFLNPNHLAAWSVAILLLAWGDPLVRRELGWRRAARLSLPTAAVLVALVVTGSRGSLVGLAAGLLVIARLGFGAWPRRVRRAAVGVALLFLVVAGLGLAMRLRQPDPFRWQRARIWTASLRIVADRPWLGTGPRQFSDIARGYQFPDGDGPLRHDRGFRSTHSDWLRVPCELGLTGAAALGAALLLALGRLRARSEAIRAGPVAALAALAAQAGVENLSTRPAVYLLAAALAGVVLSERREPTARAPAAVRLAATALVAGVFAVGEAAPYLGWRAVHGSNATPLARDAVAAARKGLARNPVHPDYWRRLAEGLATGGEAWDLERYATAREAAETAVRLNRRGAEYERMLARVEARACRTLFRDGLTRDRAIAAYAKAEQLDPFDPFLPLERGAFLLDLGEAEGAAEAASRALALEPESVLPRLLLAAAVLESGSAGSRARAEELLGEARRAAEHAGSWATSSDYARDLLTLDTEAVQRIEQGLAGGAMP